MADIPSWARDDEPKTNTAVAVPSWAADAPSEPAAPRNYAASEVPAAASANASRSMGNFVQGIKDTLSDIPGAAEGVFNTAVVGPASKLMRWSGLTDLLARAGKGAPEGELAAEIERQKAGFREKDTNAAVEHYKGRYGGWENVKRTFAEDPVGAFADALAVTGATAGRGAARVPGGVVRAADTVAVRPVTELLSGVSSEAQQIASRAGAEGGANGAAFLNNMARPDYQGMQDTLRQGVRAAKRERNATYRADMADVRNNWTPGSYGPVGRALIDAADSATEQGFLKHPDVPPVIQEMGEAIRDHYNTPGMGNDAIAFDALKQRLRSTMMAQPEGSPARAAATRVYNALGDEIRRIAPEYDGAMARYGQATRDITEIAKSLGAGENATRFSTTGKLLSALRSDASVARGARADALTDVARHVPTLPYQIAGATMNPWMPRGIVARGTTIAHGMGAAAGGAAAMPHLFAALPALAVASPHLVGLARYGAGAAGRVAGRAGITADNISRISEAMRQYEMSKDKEQ